ncbi:hypothetical protein MMC18_008858 [Xylographa bjoerkii]|nr:hypothetical protein [Xylographa bjoerkii]MCJ1395972.1 hypothetical protein [Xylographa bjoerkii]
MNGRTSSAQSLSRGSPSGGLSSTSHKAPAHKLHRAHTSTLGRLPHTRNPSYGKNLNKLTKLNATYGGDEDGGVRNQSRQKLHTPSTSPSTKDIRRNGSNVSLPRVTSRTSVKRNSSNVSLKRNGSSATQLGKTGRPTTPLRNSHTKSKPKHNTPANSTRDFSVGSDEDQDEDWTEESNSQSPSTTRQSSEGARTRPGSPPHDQLINQRQAALPDSPPESPATISSSEAPPETPRNQQAAPYTNHLSAHPPDADAVTSRLLRHHASHKLQPQLSSISATGTPGTHTPPIYPSNETPSTDPSMPADGVSRFLNHNIASGSSGGSIAHLHSALSALQSPAPTHNTRTRSPSPSAKPSIIAADPVRRAKSTGNLNSASTAPNTIEPAKRAPPSYSIDPRSTRRAGGNTAAKQELWRTQVNIESPASHTGPGLAIRGASGLQGMLGTEERRIRLWERAEGEMGYLRRFRNPVLEGVGRVVGGKGKGRRRKADDGERDKERGRAKDGREGRPASQKGERRSVRFEVGGDGAGGEEDVVEGILRRLWEGEGGGYARPEQ